MILVYYIMLILLTLDIKGDGVEETEEFRSLYACYTPSRNVIGKISIPIIRYRGSKQHFISMKDEPGRLH